MLQLTSLPLYTYFNQAELFSPELLFEALKKVELPAETNYIIALRNVDSLLVYYF